MAQKTIVQLIDDLDGTSSDSIETVTFGLDGVVYEIDLSDDNAEALRDNLSEFITSAHRRTRQTRHHHPRHCGCRQWRRPQPGTDPGHP
jgi:hypothetical protein